MSNKYNWKNIFITLGKLVITAALLYWVLKDIDLRYAWNEIRNADKILFLSTLFITWFGHFLCVLRWRILLKLLNSVLKTTRLVLIYCIGMFCNLILPGLVGGDLVKVVLTGNDCGRSYSKAIASVYFDRAIGLLALLLMALGASGIYPITIQEIDVFWGFLVLTIAFVLANILLLHPQSHNWLGGYLTRFGATTAVLKINKLSRAFSSIRQSYPRLAITFLLSLINQFLVVVSSYLLALALGIQSQFYYFLIFIPAITLITMIPISINGMGLRELATAGFFQTIGVSKPQGVALGFLFSIVIIVSSLPGSVAYLLHKDEVQEDQLLAAEKSLSNGE